MFPFSGSAEAPFSRPGLSVAWLQRQSRSSMAEGHRLGGAQRCLRAAASSVTGLPVSIPFERGWQNISVMFPFSGSAEAPFSRPGLSVAWLQRQSRSSMAEGHRLGGAQRCLRAAASDAIFRASRREVRPTPGPTQINVAGRNPVAGLCLLSVVGAIGRHPMASEGSAGQSSWNVVSLAAPLSMIRPDLIHRPGDGTRFPGSRFYQRPNLCSLPIRLRRRPWWRQTPYHPPASGAAPRPACAPAPPSPCASPIAGRRPIPTAAAANLPSSAPE